VNLEVEDALPKLLRELPVVTGRQPGIVRADSLPGRSEAKYAFEQTALPPTSMRKPSMRSVFTDPAAVQAIGRKSANWVRPSNSIAPPTNSDAPSAVQPRAGFTFGPPRHLLPLLFSFGTHLARGPHPLPGCVWRHHRTG